MPQSRKGPSGSHKPTRLKQDSTHESTKAKGHISASNRRKQSEPAKEEPTEPNPALLSHFKAILNTFQSTFNHLFTPNLPSLIQDVKQSLYLRDYVAAFGSLEKLQAYVVRWSVARALCYHEMIVEGWWGSDVQQKCTDGLEGLNIVCIGGGAGAELVALATSLNVWSSDLDDLSKPVGASLSQQDSSTPNLNLTFLDFATWSPIIDALSDNITSETPVNGVKLDKSRLKATFLQQDVLQLLSEDTISSILEADVITILFTAGELYSQSPTLATKFLLSLHTLTKPDTRLVVVDSAGGFEDLDVLKKEFDEPASASDDYAGFKLGFLLDKTLTARNHWDVIVSEDAKWWRVPHGLKEKGLYPLALENMRCLIRVYRRKDV